MLNTFITNSIAEIKMINRIYIIKYRQSCVSLLHALATQYLITFVNNISPNITVTFGLKYNTYSKIYKLM